MPDYRAMFGPDVDEAKKPDYHAMFAPNAAPMPWGEVGAQALKNAPGDAFNLAGGLAKLGTVQGLGETIGGVGKIALGGAEKLVGAQPFGDEQKAAEQVGEYFKGYTSVEGIKKKLATQPVSTAFDVATLFTPIKGAGVAGKVSKAAASRIATTAQLKKFGGAGLNLAKKSGVYFTEDFVVPLKDTLVGVADEMGFRPERASTAQLSKVMKDVDSMSTRPWSFRDIHELQQDLNTEWLKAKKAGDETVSGIAGRLRGTVREFLDNVENSNGAGLYATEDLTATQTANIFQNSLKVYRSAKTSERAEKMRALAENDRTLFATAGVAHAVKKQARQIYRQHILGKPTGYNARELETIKQLRDGSVADWVLQGARKFGNVFGAILGHSLGGPVGAAATWGIGKTAGAASDALAIRNVNRFIEAIQTEGSGRLQELLGETAHNHLMGTPRTKAAASNWVKKIATTGAKGASKSLALVIAQEVKNPSLVPRIEMELNKLVEQLQGTVPSEAQPEQQQ